MVILFLILFTITPAQADWAKNFGAQTGATVYGMSSAVDSSGNVYSAGDFDSITLVIGGVTLTRIGEKDAYVVKFDSSGNVLWAKNFGGIGASVEGRDVAVDGSGNVYLTGKFRDANLTTPALTSIDIYGDGFAIKLDSSGNTTWAKNFGGVGASTSLYSIAVDGSGNVYVSGNFSGDDITTPALTRITNSSGLGDAFVIKLDSSGNTTWAKNFGGNFGSSWGWAVAVDSSGNVYVSGTFSWDMTTPSLTIIGNEDVFAIKLNSSGTIVWGRNFGGAGSVYVSSFGIAVDSSGNVYVSGYFSNGDLTNPALTKISDFGDAFAIKLDSSGTTTWAKNFGGNGGNIGVTANTIVVDGSGNVYVVGSYNGGDLTTPALTSIANSDIFVLKLDSSGNTTWAKSFGGSGASPDGHGLAVDVSGNVYVSGEFGFASLTTPALTRVGGYDALVMKLNSSGNVTWARNYGGFGKGDLFITGMTKDTAGNIYLAGHTSSARVNFGAYTLNLIGSQDAFVAKLNSTGTAVWAKNFGGTSAYVQSSNVAVDGSGNVYLGGQFNGFNLTTPSLTLIGNYDAFAIKLDSSGNTTWSRNFGGSGTNTYGQSIAVDSSGNVYLSGDFSGTLTTPALTAIGIQDSYAIKLNSSGTITWSQKFGGSGAFAYNKSVAVDSSGNVYLGGYFETANLTTPALTLAGYQDSYAIKLNSGGTITWSQKFGGSGASTYGQSIAVDASGNVYLAGQFTGVDLTTPVLTLIGATDAFAIKLNSSGTITWAKNFGGPGANVNGRGIAVDSGGNVYLGGDFSNANMTTPSLTAIGSQDAFIARLNSSGTTTLANNFGGSGAYADVRGLSADGTGNILIAGNLSFGDLTTPAVSIIGNSDGYVINVQLYNAACTVAGKIKYDIANNIMVFCDGSFWQSMNSNTASTCTGTTTGKFQYYSNGASSDIVWYGGSCRSAKGSTTYGACAVNGKVEWSSANNTVRGCINGTWTSLQGW